MRCQHCQRPIKKGSRCCSACKQAPDLGSYLPTAEEIAAGCAAIRQNWSEAEHAKRLGVKPTRLEVEVYKSRV